MLQARGDRRTMCRDRSRTEVNSDAATQIIRKSLDLSNAPPKDSNRVWNSGDGTAWKSQVMVIATIDSTPQGLVSLASDRGGRFRSGMGGPVQKDDSRSRDWLRG
ncbi:hypothetical protein N7517_011003 [Penicillium concentricum]|uniref:Uncharacterized protein n=1 Tax=Penicillium concentricum TaxID=293559 RepID=A0A9W9UTV6_9EURO|nr:uncharacterized protein N7517_011003 [Penicillium concentricum]KAJ5356394.1 hypothetical protein N7517_011003 [Penicillium concentricum]